MNRILLVVTFFMNVVCAMHAQQTHEMEPSMLEIAYNTSFLGEIKNKPGCMRSNLFILRCGKQTSQYFCADNLRSDSLNGVPGGHKILYEEIMRETANYHDISKRRTYTPSYREYLYRDLASGKVDIYTSLGGEGLRITDTPTMTWSIVADSTKEILGYECIQAETTFRGRQWKVWFCMDIPLPVGPWKFNGLPGIILQAECQGFLNIEAGRISAKGLTPVKFYNYFNKSFSNVSRESYLKKITDSSRYPKNTLMTPQMETE